MVSWYFFFLNSVSDTPKDDLLGHFEECLEFIDAALADGKNVLVHWLVHVKYLFETSIFSMSCCVFNENLKKKNVLYPF